MQLTNLAANSYFHSSFPVFNAYVKDMSNAELMQTEDLIKSDQKYIDDLQMYKVKPSPIFKKKAKNDVVMANVAEPFNPFFL